MSAASPEGRRCILRDEDFDPRISPTVFAGPSEIGAQTNAKEGPTAPDRGKAWKAMKEHYPLTEAQRRYYFECDCGAAFRNFPGLHAKHEVYCEVKQRKEARAKEAADKFLNVTFQPIDVLLRRAESGAPAVEP